MRKGSLCCREMEAGLKVVLHCMCSSNEKVERKERKVGVSGKGEAGEIWKETNRGSIFNRKRRLYLQCRPGSVT